MNTSLHDASAFVEPNLFIREEDNVVAHIKREIYIIDDLSAKALIGIEITAAIGCIIDLDVQLLIIPRLHGISLQIDT